MIRCYNNPKDQAKEAVKEGFDAEIKVEVKKDGDLSELEQKMADLESAMEEKQQQIEDAKEALEQLESARDALEAVSDQAAVEGAFHCPTVRLLL